MKYTSIQGTGVVAHRTELTVEEKYAVMNVIELAMFAGDTKPDFSKLLLRNVCRLATVLVAEPQCDDNTKVLADTIDELNVVIAQARHCVDDGGQDISANGCGMKVTPLFVINAEKAHDAACNLAETRYRCAADEEDYNTSPEHFLVTFMNDLMKRLNEA